VPLIGGFPGNFNLEVSPFNSMVRRCIKMKVFATLVALEALDFKCRVWTGRIPTSGVAMSFSSLTRTIVLFAVFAVGGLLARSECFPKGVYDAGARVGYVGEDTSTKAIDLQSGKILWSSLEANSPLCISRGILAAADYKTWKSGQFTVVILDSQTGKLRVRSRPIALGLSPSSSVDPPPTVDARFEKDRLVLRWESSSRYRGGAAPPVQQVNTFPAKVTHIVTMDPVTGDVTERLPEVTKASSDVVPPNSVSYRRLNEWQKGPWLVGDSSANIESDAEDKGSKIQLRVWDNQSGNLEARTNLERTGEETSPYVTADGKYLLLPDSETSGSWRVFSVMKPHEIGHVRLDPNPEDICIVGAQLYYLSSISVTPKTKRVLIKAVDLASGRQLWEQSLGERQISNMPRLPQ